MNPGFRRRTYVLSAVLLMALLTLTYRLVLKDYPLPSLRAAIDLADNWLLGLALLCAAGYVLGEAACIHTLLRALGQRLSYRSTLAISAVGVYFSAITPSSSGGQPAQVYYLSKRGVPAAQGTVTLLVVTVVYKAVLLLVGLPLALLDGPIVFIGLPYFRVLFVLGIVTNLVLITSCLLLMFSKKLVYRLTAWALRLMERLRLQKKSRQAREKLDRQLDEYHAAADFLRTHRRTVAGVAVYTVLQRLSVFSGAYCVYRAFGLRALNWLDVVAIQSAIALAVDSLPLPGAVGAAEGVFLGLYDSVYGPLLVVPALLLTRGAAYYVPALLCGAFTACYVLAGVLRRKKEREQV